MERATTDWRQVILLFTAGLLAAAQFGKVSLSLAGLDGYYGGAAAVPFLVSMVSVMGIVFGPVMGGIVTRLGVRRALIGALALGAAVSALEALLLPLPVMIALRLIEGASHLTLVVALPTLMAEAASARDKPVVMGLWGTYFGVTFALLALALPGLVQIGGVSAVFILHAVLMAVMALVLAPVLPRGVTERVAFNLTEELRAIYTSPRLLAPGLIFVWHALTYIALLSFLPAALGAPGLGTLLPLVSLFGTFAAGFAARRIAPARLAAGAFAANLVMALVLLWLPGAGAWLALPLFFSIGLVPGAGFAAIPWLNSDIRARARANGALAQLGNVGTFAGTPIMAAAGVTLAPLMGVTLVFAAGGLVLAALIAWRFMTDPATAS